MTGTINAITALIGACTALIAAITGILAIYYKQEESKRKIAKNIFTVFLCLSVISAVPYLVTKRTLQTEAEAYRVAALERRPQSGKKMNTTKKHDETDNPVYANKSPEPPPPETGEISFLFPTNGHTIERSEYKISDKGQVAVTVRLRAVDLPRGAFISLINNVQGGSQPWITGAQPSTDFIAADGTVSIGTVTFGSPDDENTVFDLYVVVTKEKPASYDVIPQERISQSDPIQVIIEKE